MNVLALDTSSRQASIAVLQNDEIVAEFDFSTSDNLSAVLVPNVEFVLGSLKMPLAAIDLFAAAVGPGLYTGIRIGLATLKGLLFGLRKPFVPVLTLHALAWKYAGSGRSIVPLIDARRGEVCLAAYRFDDERLTELISPLLLPVGEISRHVAAVTDPLFVGSGAKTHRDELPCVFSASGLQDRSPFLAVEIGRIAHAEHNRQKSLSDPDMLEPFYLRPVEPETAADLRPRRECAS